MSRSAGASGKSMLRADYFTILESRSQGEFCRYLERFTQRLGFSYFGAIVVIDHPGSETQFLAVNNAPEGYREVFQSKESGRVDPVMQHCKTSSLPIAWDQRTYVEAGMGAKWEHQAGFGYRTGIICALHLPRGRHFVFGLDRDERLPKDAAEVSRQAADLMLFATFAREAADRHLTSPPDERRDVCLSSRELECLKWTLEGKTAWELGRILGIAEQTAVRHLHNASKKLLCSGKHQAVIRALRLGLIS